jgi:hypothetical protein
LEWQPVHPPPDEEELELDELLAGSGAAHFSPSQLARRSTPSFTLERLQLDTLCSSFPHAEAKLPLPP